MRIVVDAMGSDNHPEPDVLGAVEAARAFGDTLILTGDEKQIATLLAAQDTTGLDIQIRHASQAIGMTDKPSDILKGKPDSSVHAGLKLVKEGEADAFVSMGNTGAILGVAMLRQFGVGRFRGIKRPSIGVIFPIKEQPFLIDSGTNAECKPEYLLQFGIMGSLYMARMRGIENPRVGLISNGEEEGKGTALIREAMPLLAASGLNYIGSVEPKEFMFGGVDVAVCDGFTGNILMKTAEAIAKYMSNELREQMQANPITAVGGLLAKPAFAKVRKQLDPEEVGGAPLLGVNGVVIIGHGRSSAYAVKQAVGQARRMVENGVVEAITTGIQ
jgi:glycerol-3-phosphate acyltransferase PlsX